MLVSFYDQQTFTIILKVIDCQDQSNFFLKRKSETSSMDATHFPTALHTMLTAIDRSDNGDEKIISWQENGKSFMIRNKEEFISKILPK